MRLARISVTGGVALAAVVGVGLWRGPPKEPARRAAHRGLVDAQSVQRTSRGTVAHAASVGPGASAGPVRRAVQRTSAGEAHDASAGAELLVSEARTAAQAEWAAGQFSREATEQWTQYLSEALHDLEIDGELDEVVCKEHLCRLQMHFANLSQALRFRDAAGMSERRKALEFSVTDDQVDVEVFVVPGDKGTPAL